MASAPLWNQTYDHNQSRLSDGDSYKNSAASVWTREIGETTVCESDLTVTVPVTDSLTMNGVRPEPELDSNQLPTDTQAVNVTVSDNPTEAVSNASKDPRPPKIRPDERIASIMDNPFFKSFGGSRSPRSLRAEVPALLKGGKMSVDYGELGEYKPGSGYVHKLSGRFASLGVQEKPRPSNQMKHASSFDNIIDEKVCEHSEADSQQDKGNKWSGRMQHRWGSVESLNGRKPSPIFPVLRPVVRKWEHPASPTKSPRETHVEAPDVPLARDDIILIENTPELRPPSLENEVEKESNEENGGSQISSVKDELTSDELPKPNTVSAVRSLFESGKAVESEPTTSVDESVLTPRQSDSSPSPGNTVSADTDLTVIADDGSLSQTEASRTPSSRDFTSDMAPQPEPAPLHTQSSSVTVTEVLQMSDASQRSFQKTSDKESVGNVDSQSAMSSDLSTHTSASCADDTKPADAETVQPSLFLSSSRSGFRPVVPPRSTAAVKAIPVSKPVIPSSSSSITNVPRFNTSVPPSFIPSVRKFSPVVPVAPFKEKVEEGDSNRSLIYSKKSSISKPKRVPRVKDYGEISVDTNADIVKKEEEMKVDDVQITKRTSPEPIENRVSPVLDHKPEEENESTEDTVIESAESKNVENQWRVALKPVSQRIEDTAVEKPPASAPRAFFSKLDAKSKMETRLDSKDSQRAVSPCPEKQKEEMKTEVVKVETMEIEVGKEETEEEVKTEDKVKTEDSNTSTSTANNEMDDNSKTETEPVRGIPSIIANRLKKKAQGQDQTEDRNQTRAPGELFGVRLGKTRFGADTDGENNEIPIKRLTSASEHAGKETTSSEPTEIQNQFANVLKRKQPSNRNRSTGVSEIFDSSKLQKKRREKKAAAAREAQANSSGSGSATSTSSQAASNVCKIEFIGANVTTGRSLLTKNRTVKISVSFHDVLVQKFEYPSEEQMLEEYMRDHPDEVLVLEEVSWPTESSDDSDFSEKAEGLGLLSHDSDLLKSNTSLAHSGNLQSYRGKFQQEYELGSILNVPDKEPEPQAEPEPVDPDSMQIVPADEEDLHTYSVDTSSDLLF